MNKKWLTAVIVVLAIAVSGVGGFFLGKGMSDRTFGQEKELSVKLNLSDGSKLSQGDGSFGCFQQPKEPSP